MTKIANQPLFTMDELDDDALDRVSGGESNFMHVVAVAVANTVNETLIEKAGTGFSKSLG